MYQDIFIPMVVKLLLLITFSIDTVYVWILLGESWCWSLQRLKVTGPNLFVCVLVVFEWCFSAGMI